MSWRILLLFALSSRQLPQTVIALRRQCRGLQLAFPRGHLRRAGWRTWRIPQRSLSIRRKCFLADSEQAEKVFAFGPGRGKACLWQAVPLAFRVFLGLQQRGTPMPNMFLIGGVVPSLAGGLRSWLLCGRGAGISSFFFSECETAWRGQGGEASLKAWLLLIGWTPEAFSAQTRSTNSSRWCLWVSV